jgi:3'-phosphoadenosine 5'-phosphosulfate sulfotransferase (PAPS reductase)/FAD synthetase
MIIAWFSGGVTSAVACKIAQENYENVCPTFIETGGHHRDMPRFLKDCEEWFNVKIKILQDKRFVDHIDLCEKLKVVNFVSGAECSRTLKKKVRQKYEKSVPFQHQVFGFEFEKKEINRAVRFREQNPDTNPIFPLIDRKLNKANCMSILLKANIEIPEMYRLGYSNNNCVGCVKGGAGYWNKIRVDFPEVFQRMAEVERKIGRTCIKGKFLDQLNPKAGRHKSPPMPECDVFCEVEAAEIISKETLDILNEE